VSKGNIVLIVPLNPAYPALAGRGTCRPNAKSKGQTSPIGLLKCGIHLAFACLPGGRDFNIWNLLIMVISFQFF
jgi:hypothetical protein